MRQLLIIRHAIAVPREEFESTGLDDGLRPLTPDGRRKMKRNVKALRTLVPSIDVLAASPLVRARDTAEIVAVAYENIPIRTTPALGPDRDPSSFLTWLRKQPGSVVAAVGHEPHLGTLVTWLVSGVARPNVELRKGGVCLLELTPRPGKGAAVLKWLLTPSQLRSLCRY